MIEPERDTAALTDRTWSAWLAAYPESQAHYYADHGAAFREDTERTLMYAAFRLRYQLHEIFVSIIEAVGLVQTTKGPHRP